MFDSELPGIPELNPVICDFEKQAALTTEPFHLPSQPIQHSYSDYRPEADGEMKLITEMVRSVTVMGQSPPANGQYPSIHIGKNELQKVDKTSDIGHF